MSSVFTHQGGKVLANIVVSGAVAVVTYSVPRGKKWTIFQGYAERDVNATLILDIIDAAFEPVWESATEAAGVTNLHFSELADADDVTFLLSHPILAGGWHFRMRYGAAQTTPVTRLWVLET